MLVDAFQQFHVDVAGGSTRGGRRCETEEEVTLRLQTTRQTHDRVS